MKLNETPVRTSRNFNINNIKLDDVNIPEEIGSFDTFKIIGANANSNTENYKLTYGLGEELTKLVQEKGNKNISLTFNSPKSDEVQLLFTFNNKNINLLENIQLIIESNSKANVIIKYSSEDDIKFFHNGILKVIAKDYSELNIVIVNLLNNKSNNFLSIENDLSISSKVNYTIVDFGGKNSITNYYSNIKGISSENNLRTIYLGEESQLFDLNYIAELSGEKTNVNIDIQGALKDNSKKHFKGTIDFKKGSKKAKGNENESCLLLSNKAKSLSLPMLLSSEEDVEGNHACSAGKVDEKELFYIMTRGFEYKEAMKLMVKAKFNKILDNILNEALKNEILKEIDKKID